MLDKILLKSQIIELKVQEEFLRYGFDVSLPLFNTSRYDLIVDTGKEILKIQTKKSIGKDEDSFQFSCTTQNTNSNTGKTKHKYTDNEVDYFATVWKDKVYLIPLEETSKIKTLRFSENVINNCKQYLAENVLASYDRLSDEELYNYSISNNEHKNYCIECGAPITQHASLCIQCNAKHNRVVERPSREKLKELIYTTPFTQIGRMYYVSDNAVRKWCKQENLPTKKSDIIKYTQEEWQQI